MKKLKAEEKDEGRWLDVPRPAFSSKDRLFGDWLKRGNRTTKYAKHIEKLHIIFPDRCLKDLSDLKKPDYDLSSETWESLQLNYLLLNHNFLPYGS